MWKTLVHNGPYVQPKYERIASPGAPRLFFDGKEFEVPAEVEQYFILYCKYGAPKDDLFVENFFSTIWELFPQVLKAKLRGWHSSKADLSQYYEYLAAQDIALSPEEKLEKKARALELKEYHSKCVLDGVEQTIGGYAVEPASIFKGLGDNPNRGKVKFAVTPEEITINTSIPADKFPKPPYGKWGAIVSDHDKLYVASFRSNVTGKIKYIYLNRNSDFKTNSEIEKYEKARNLALIVDEIREEYHTLLDSADLRERELGLAIYLIDRYAFRVGNEPSTGSGAETTGATTLTRDNVRLLKGNKVAFHFVAKDSIVYDETKRMDEDAYKVLAELVNGVHGGAQRPGALFSISASSVNKWLEAKMTGLTAKVFRTYNASILIQRELLDKNMSRFNDEKKLNEFTKVNTEIALICNHKRAVPPEKREKVEAAIREIDEIEEPTEKQIAKREKLLRDKMTLGVALSTSKMNYIDPRLVYTWCAKNKVDPSKIYAKTMLEATAWAADEADFSYTV